MNVINEFIKFLTDRGVSYGLAVAYLVVSALIVIMAVVYVIMWLLVLVRYLKTNRMTCSGGKTSCEVAKEVLAASGLGHIKVMRANFFRAWFFGNCYSITKKTIFLRRNIYDRNSLTAVGLALQKVGVAKMCEGNVKMAKARNYMQIVGIFGPFLFIPIILIGGLIDIFLFQSIGTFSIASIIIGLVILLAGFVVTFLNIPVEKKANNMALEMLESTGVCNAEERKQIKKVLNTYIIAYICDFILTILRIAQIVLEIVINSQINKNN